MRTTYLFDMSAGTFTWTVPKSGALSSMHGSGAAILSTDPALTIAETQLSNDKVYECIGRTGANSRLDLHYPVQKGEKVFLATGGERVVLQLDS